MTRASARLLLPLATLLLLAACTRAAAPAVEARGEDAAPSAWSVLDLGSTWRDQTGAARPLASLAGRPRLVAMIYTHCSSTCPIAVDEMKLIAAATDASVGLVLVSLDPARDSVASLAEYARAHGLAPARWTLLTGADDDVRDLAASLGVRYRRVSPEELAHSNTLTLLDAAGRVVHQQQGLGEREETIAAARALLRRP